MKGAIVTHLRWMCSFPDFKYSTDLPSPKKAEKGDLESSSMSVASMEALAQC
jgi:hypothetical protein